VGLGVVGHPAAPSEGKEESSFSEEKEAKRLFPVCAAQKGIKVFWFFFSKKNLA
jgi:hypothetical protein